jgi:predicted S18 family serine protease
MKTLCFARSLVLLLLVLALAAGTAAAAAPTAPAAGIKILAPADGAQVGAGESYSLEYEVTLGPGDDHFHVWVDGDRSPASTTSRGPMRCPS